MIDRAARARLLALDRRRPRPDWQSGREPRIAAATYKSALRDLVSIMDHPSDGKWDAAAVRRLDEIRALARIVEKMDGKTTRKAVA